MPIEGVVWWPAARTTSELPASSPGPIARRAPEPKAPAARLNEPAMSRLWSTAALSVLCTTGLVLIGAAQRGAPAAPLAPLGAVRWGARYRTQPG